MTPSQCLTSAFVGIAAGMMMSSLYAGQPVWTLIPTAGSQTVLLVSNNSSYTVQYTVQNNSTNSKTNPKILAIDPVFTPGVIQTTPCIVQAKGQPGDTCILNLTIDGSKIPATGIHAGPSLCLANANGSPNPNQCYQPATAFMLNITKVRSLLIFSQRPSFPGNTAAGGEVRFRYELSNVGQDVVSLSNINQMVTDGALAVDATRTTCEDSLAPGASCWLAFRYLTPPIQGMATGKISISYGGEEPLVDNTLNFNFQRPLFAFITNFSAATVRRCVVNPITGFFNNCANTGSGFNNGQGIALNATNTIAFILNDGNSLISRCDVNATTGALTNCNDAGATGLSNLRQIALNNASTYALISTPNPASVSLCNVNPTTGAISNCANTGSGFSAPVGIVLDASNTIAFITNGTTSTVFRCNANPTTGALSNCGDTGGTGFSNPVGIALNATNTLAYIGNNTGDTISSCEINALDGSFSNCMNLGTTGSNFPFGITLNAYGSVAFITSDSASRVYRCDVNQTNGAFSNCSFTGSGFNDPEGIVLSGNIILN